MSTLLAMCLFAFAMSASPGPVNVLALTNGLNLGFKRAIPFVAGATLGFTCLLVSVALGLMWLLEQMPWLSHLMNVIAIFFLLYIAYLLFFARASLATGDPKFAYFSTGFAMQWLNPKAWVACLTGVSTFELIDAPWALMAFSTLYTIICFVAIAAWAWIGHSALDKLADGAISWLNKILAVLFLMFALYLLRQTLIGF